MFLGRVGAVPGYAEKLERQIRDAGLSANARMVGQVGYDEIPDYYNASDVVVSMAKTEGFPNSVLEVMCCGRPLVVGRIPQIEEILQDGVDCRMCGIDASELAGNITDLVQHPDRAGALGDSAYRKGREVGDIDRNGRRFAADLKQYMADFRSASVLNLLAYRFVFLLFMVQRRLFRY
jgi:glycosyltransferase involved in cell wall biosynthesis